MPFHAEHAELVKFVNDMKTQHDIIGDRIQKAHMHAQSLQGPTFQGGAGKAFQSTFEQFLTSANKMNEALMKNSENLKSAGDQYAQMEEGNLSTLQKTADTLNWA
ncbi:WXG100 family type VII secretion target [Nocardia vermiculata]|uniref:WXG100 family type VII secretion target n=1 Tax=Nocardia vermiculata TaxID=257274 RepID=A0A846XZF7_9NOCA|nr:WXG100 family type VII secretion target [Nocardia vermiculata]NKY50428.1 WXG100 family type VII secretion target [Nocardia vermiculata]